MLMKIQIDFFSTHMAEAIGAGVYKISVVVNGGHAAPLYIGESAVVLVRCATHLFELRKNPGYFGFTKDTIENPNITLKFELLCRIDDGQKRKRYEKDIIAKTLKTQSLICQSGISDRMNGIKEKISAMQCFLWQNGFVYEHEGGHQK